jgi:phosphoribosylformimino-5-aminoimidazole carboxamide ribotide isomerase
VRVVGVLDLLGGQVVRGIAGRRAEYRPVVSTLTRSTRPVDVARAFRERLGLAELYIADLDAIGGAAPAWAVLEELRTAEARLWVDAGVRRPEEAVKLAAAGVESVVVGLETVAGPAALAETAAALGAGLIFSLDLREGRPLGQGWAGGAAEIAGQAVALGARRVLVLDLVRVGVGSGVGTEELCAALARAHPEVEVSAGGGVRGADDLRRLMGLGVRAALLASALHDGRLTRADVEALAGPQLAGG